MKQSVIMITVSIDEEEDRVKIDTLIHKGDFKRLEVIGILEQVKNDFIHKISPKISEKES